MANVTVQLATTSLFEELKDTHNPFVTLLLYHVSENTEVRNSGQRRLLDGSMSRQPLGLELRYLVTPWAVRTNSKPETDEQASREEHNMLGLIMQTFYDHAEIGHADLADDATAPVWQPFDSLQLVLESLPVEDHYRIWDASELSYRVSATYLVRVVGLDPEQTVSPPRVSESVVEVAP